MPDKTKNKVLIIEDEQDIRTIYAEVLQNAGYVVDQAPNGEVGGDKIKNSEWSILLLDIMLPGKDGLKILKDLKET
ncbi:MAG: Response regulator receiver protein, partial [candidate division WWE3 bacterium GW2011_GWD1_42_70]